MLSVLYSEYELWGCPNCGCDSVISSGVSGGGLTSGTCRHCKLKFEVRSENPMGIVKYGCHTGSNPVGVTMYPSSESCWGIFCLI